MGLENEDVDTTVGATRREISGLWNCSLQARQTILRERLSQQAFLSRLSEVDNIGCNLTRVLFLQVRLSTKPSTVQETKFK